MAHRSRGPLNPLQFGLMGFAIGGLKFQLDINVQQMAEEAEMRKQARLQELQQQNQIAQEQRNNVEYDRRAAIDHGYRVDEATTANDLQITRDDHLTNNDIRKETVVGAQTLTREQIMENQRAEDARRQAEHDAQLARGTHAYTRTFDAVAAEKDPNYFAGQRGADQKGVLGSDGKTYKFGEPLPPGVTAQGGYGVSWAPSASKSRPSARPGARPGLAPLPGNTSPTAPQAYPDGTKLRGADGRIYVVQNGVPVPM